MLPKLFPLQLYGKAKYFPWAVYIMTMCSNSLPLKLITSYSNSQRMYTIIVSIIPTPTCEVEILQGIAVSKNRAIRAKTHTQSEREGQRVAPLCICRVCIENMAHLQFSEKAPLFCVCYYKTGVLSLKDLFRKKFLMHSR